MKKSSLVCCAFFLLGLFGWGDAALADPVLVSFPQDLTLNAQGSDFATPQQFAGGVNLGQPSIVTDVHWSGGYNDNSNPSDDFTIRFFQDTGSGVPTASPFAEFTQGDLLNFSRVGPLGMNVDGINIFSYSADLPSGVLLDSNTPYWLSIVNNTSGGAAWGWQRSSGPNSGAFRFADGNPWNSAIGTSLAFDLTGRVVPEPTSIALFGLSIAGLAAFGWRRRNLA